MKIGVMLELWENPAVGLPITFAQVRDLALEAEGAGFDSAWLIDHLGFRSSEARADGVWECWTFLSALAPVTRRLELGTLVACTQ
jgi:FMNH2-dependent dimethyl sulfone monooxygenase